MRRWVYAALVALLLAGFVTGGLVRLRTDTTVASLLPAGDPALESLSESARAFGGDPVVILAESVQPGDLVGTQLNRLLDLEAALSRLPDVAVVYGPGTMLNQIAGTAQNLLASISGRRDGIKLRAEADAKARGASPAEVDTAVRDSTKEFDAHYGALLVRGLPAGLPTLRNPQFVSTIVFDAAGNPRPEMRYLVPTPNAVGILVRPRDGLDQVGTEGLVEGARAAVERSGLRTSRLTVSGSPAVAAALGSTVVREVPLLGGVAVALIAICYQLLPWTRRRAHRLLPLAATLGSTALTLAAFGWLDRPLSLGVIAFLPIMIGIGSDFPAYLLHGGAPRWHVVLVALASAVGFAALGLSPLPFVRDLGLALALGLMLALAVALGLRRFFAAPPLVNADEPSGAGVTRHSRATRLGVLAGAVAIAAGGWAALPHIGVEAQPQKLAAGVPALDEAAHTEEVLGSSGEIQVRLRGQNLRTPEALDWLRRAQDSVVTNYGSQLQPIVSLPNLLRFLGPTPSAAELASALGLLPHYLTSAVLTDDGTQAVLSLGMSLQDLGAQKALLDGMRAALPPPPAGTSADVVGLPVAAARGFELISASRYLTNLAGIAAAGLVLLLGLRRPRVAGRAVLAAVLATGWGLGATWLLGISLSPLSVALGSLTTATACEFTVLLGYVGTLRKTVAAAAGAACLGYLALGVSQLALIRDFGFLLAGTVALSLLAAHLVVRIFPDT